VTLTISQIDGQPLPSWMTFDVKSGAFTGQAPPGVTGTVGVRVVARDQKGYEAVSTIQVVIE
ncbi:MAG: putative Ig domain-containing protein, partial [Betaproteobacteria bacterium]|nr:putative Ig domain-containing protein [Betaproteobacteria bacterium]